MGGASPLPAHKTMNACSKAQLVSDLEMFSSPQTCISMVGNDHPLHGQDCALRQRRLVSLRQGNTTNPQAQQSPSRKRVCICLL